MRLATVLICAVLTCLVATGCDSDVPDTADGPPAPPVVVYSARESISAVLKTYTEESGVSILLTTESSRALIDRLGAEKKRATADLVIVDDIGHLWRATEIDILRPSISQILATNIPERLRDPENTWFGLSVFARTIAYDKRTVTPQELTTYAALGDERWRGRLCLTTAANVHNRSQIAMMIEEDGERPTELAVRAWVANLAIPFVTDDVELLQAIENGRCALGIVGSHSLGRYARDKLTTSVAGLLPPASSGGAYVNIVGAGVTRHASNPAGALHLLEWLASEPGQDLLAESEFEIPVGQLDKWSALNINPTNLAAAGYYHQDAEMLMDRAKWRK